MNDSPNQEHFDTADFALDPIELPRTRHINQLRVLATLLDSQFLVPGTRFRFGIEGLIGLVPGVGDALGFALGGIIVYRAARLGAPLHLIVRMLGNILVDAALGIVPFVGDLFDFTFKANARNLRLLLHSIEGRQGFARLHRPRSPRQSTRGLQLLLVIGTGGLVLASSALFFFTARLLIDWANR